MAAFALAVTSAGTHLERFFQHRGAGPGTGWVSGHRLCNDEKLSPDLVTHKLLVFACQAPLCG